MPHPVIVYADQHVVVVDKPAGLTTMRHADEAAEHGARAKKYLPQTLQDLLLDDRSPVPLRYLRRLYFDPMTNSADWQLVLAPEGGIKGVYSGSTLTPIKRANFAPIDALFADSDCYCAWQFVYEPRLRRWGAPGNPAPGNPAPGNPTPGGPAPGIPVPGYPHRQ